MDETLAPGRDDDTAEIPVVASTSAHGRHAAPPPRRSAGWWALRIAREAGIVLGIALLASILVRLVLLEPLYVSGPAMSPTLGAGDRVLVAKGLSSVTGLSRGDVVAFADPDNWQDIPAPSTSVFSTALAVLGIAPSPDDDVVMRVIGVGGDRVECCDAQGRILVNGQAVDEDYLPAGMPTDQVTFDVVVPADSYFVLGDDRALARDSRYHLEVNDGAVPDANVLGRVIMRAWPPQVLTTPEVFASVPEPQGAP